MALTEIGDTDGNGTVEILVGAQLADRPGAASHRLDRIGR